MDVESGTYEDPIKLKPSSGISVHEADAALRLGKAVILFIYECQSLLLLCRLHSKSLWNSHSPAPPNYGSMCIMPVTGCQRHHTRKVTLKYLHLCLNLFKHR